MLKNKQIKIVEKFKIFIIIALVVALAGVGFIVFRGMNIGIDFMGGVKIEADFDAFAENSDCSKIIRDDMKKVIADHGLEIMGDVQVSDSTFEIRLRNVWKGVKVTSENESEFVEFVQGKGDTDGLCQMITKSLQKLAEENATLKAAGAEFDDNSVKAYTVGATASGALLRNAIIALCVAIVVMLIYIVIRFTLASALAAVCALIHDVIIMIALTAIFNIPVNSTFIAAVITIVGYSINATIIIFDRIRESVKDPNNADKPDAQIANEAIANTIGRTILTTVTTLVMVVALAVLSVNAIQEFIFPIIFGLLAGAFSSVLLAPSFWVMFRKIEKKAKAKKQAKKGYQGAVAANKETK
ncbi:MAG TPA: protein translocase subunit SecF [Clostridiales bacterium]|nr:protein translocase subunit SecF [Clostridiales bacterium]